MGRKESNQTKNKKIESAFSSFYLRSLGSQENDLRSLGPIVATQVVKGRRAKIL